MKLFKIFSVILGVMQSYASFAATTSAGAYVQNSLKQSRAFHIFVKDAAGKPVEGIVITTQNLKKNVSATTNSAGEAVFEDRCAGWAKLGRAYTQERQKNPKTTTRPVLIKATDPHGKYKPFTGYLEWNDRTATGCRRDIKFSKDSVKETFPRPEQLKKLAFDSRTGDVKFYSFCTGESYPKACGSVFSQEQGTIDCACVHTFEKVDTQANEAVLLAKEYMQNKVISEDDWKDMDVKCNATPIRSKGNQDFISCTSGGGKYAYDFEFDDITEGTDRVVLADTAMGLCENVYGGKFRSPGVFIGMCQKDSASKTQAMCDKLRAATYDFSWTTYYDAPSQSCIFNYREANKNYTPKNKIAGKTIDITKYENINVRSLPSLEFLIRQYVQAQIGYTLDDFRCAQGFRPYGSKHLLDCHAFTGGQDYVVEFVFDDLNEWKGLTSNAGEGGVGCIGSGGSFDGSQCVGLTREQCKELDKKAPGGATWDESIKQCTLNDAAKLETLKKIGDTIVTGVTIAGTVVIVVATAGTAAPAIAALAVAGGTLSVGGTLLTENIEYNLEQQVEKFKKAYNNCKNQSSAQEQSQCARSVLQSYFGYIDTYISKDVFDGQYGKSLDEIFQGLIDLTEPDRITKEEITSYQTQIRQAKANVSMLTTAKISTAVGDLLLLTAGGITGAKKILSKHGVTLTAGGTAVVNVSSKSSKISHFFARIYNVTNKTTGNVYTARSAVESGISETGKILSATKSASCWVDGYLVTCN